MLVVEERKARREKKKKICSIILYDWRQIIMMQRLRTHVRSTKRRHQYHRGERERARANRRKALIVICMYMCACTRTRAKFYQTVSTYVVVYGVLPSNPSLSSRRTETIEEEDYTDWYAKENAFSNSYTTCLVRLFNKHRFFLLLHSIRMKKRKKWMWVQWELSYSHMHVYIYIYIRLT